MNKLERLTVTGLLVIAFTGGGIATNLLASDTQPGSAGDPLVTKSYVDDKISQLSGGASIEPSVYVPVSAASGQLLIGHEGTEIILRSGKGVAYCSGENGVVNVTTGEDVTDGAAVSANHMLIVPRYDGRGIRAETDVWFMVKGGYDLID